MLKRFLLLAALLPLFAFAQYQPPGVQYAEDASGKIIGLLNPGGSVPIAVNTPIASLKLLPDPGSGTQAGDATNGVIFNTQLPALGKFYGVKLIYENYDTANTQNWDGVKVAPAPASISGGNNTLTFTGYVTVNGSQSFSVPVATTGAGGQLIPGVVVTDFIQVTSIARTDTVGAPPILRVASHIVPSSNSTTHPNYAGANYANFNALSGNPGLVNGVYAFTGSGATLASLTSTGNSLLNGGGNQNPIGAVFYYSTLKEDSFWFCDSLCQGYGTTTQYAGFAEYVTFNAYASGTQFTGSNFATSGQKTVDTLARLKAVIGVYKPKYAVFKPWSPNDGNTTAIFAQSWGYTLEMVNYCLANGVQPVILTAPFATGYSNTLIQAQNALALALPTSVRKVDAYSILTPGGTWVSAYNSGDSEHPNDAGSSAVATAFIAAVTY